MFYGIEQSTDLRDPRTSIKKFRSSNSARRWLNEYINENIRYVYKNPDLARNHHQWIRRVYEVIKMRPPSERTLAEEARKDSTRDYPRTSLDMLAKWITSYGDKILLESGVTS